MRPHHTAAAVVLLIAAASNTAFADGKAMPLYAHPVPHMPQQSAIIHFRDGVQYMAIETQIAGEGEQFAWVIPTPSPAEVEQVTRGLFPQLRTQLAPRIVHDPPKVWPVIAVGLVLLLAIAARLYIVAAAIIGFILLSSILLPSLSARAPAEVGVTVHERKIVGAFDIAVLSGGDGQALTQWLDANGFATPDTVKPVIAAYIADGWSFVAAKLRNERDDANPDPSPTVAPHPLGLRFATASPIYPLRLTGVDNGDLDVELFVFADRRAEADGFDVRRCSILAHPLTSTASYERWRVPIYHRQLSRIVAGDRVVTHLAGRLTEQQMTSDAAIRLVEFDAHEPVRFSTRGARITASNVSIVILLGGAAIIALRGGRQKFNRAHLRQVAWVVAGSLVVGVIVFAALPKVAIATHSGEHWVRSQSAPSDLADAIATVLAQQDANASLTVESARAIAGEVLAGRHDSLWANGDQPFDFRNAFTGRPMIEEDSPGNYTIALDDDHVCVVHHDVSGSEWPIHIERRRALRSTR